MAEKETKRNTRTRRAPDPDPLNQEGQGPAWAGQEANPDPDPLRQEGVGPAWRDD